MRSQGPLSPARFYFPAFGPSLVLGFLTAPMALHSSGLAAALAMSFVGALTFGWRSGPGERGVLWAALTMSGFLWLWSPGGPLMRVGATVTILVLAFLTEAFFVERWVKAAIAPSLPCIATVAWMALCRSGLA